MYSVVVFRYKQKNKTEESPKALSSVLFLLNWGLLADTEFLLCDDRAVTVDVLADQVVEEAAALAYESLEGTGCGEVLVVVLKMLGEVLDAYREESDLALGAAGVAGAASVSLEDFLLFFC